MKEKLGRLKLDSFRYLQNQAWTHDVVDLDAYGSPWRHLFEVVKRVNNCSPVTVFLTVANTIWKQQQAEAMAFAGIGFEVPPAIEGQLADYIFDHCLAAPVRAGLRIESAAEALNPGGNARYIGMQICKK